MCFWVNSEANPLLIGFPADLDMGSNRQTEGKNVSKCFVGSYWKSKLPSPETEAAREADLGAHQKSHVNIAWKCLLDVQVGMSSGSLEFRRGVKTGGVSLRASASRHTSAKTHLAQTENAAF